MRIFNYLRIAWVILVTIPQTSVCQADSVFSLSLCLLPEENAGTCGHVVLRDGPLDHVRSIESKSYFDHGD